MCRQASLPSASSDLSLPESQINWVDQLEIDNEKVQLRKKIPSTDSTDEILDSLNIESPINQKPPTTLPTSTPVKSQEPNIDLELDVKVFINSGKCVLHTKDPIREEEIKLSRMRKDRSCSAGMLEFQSANSPDPVRRNREKLTSQSSSSKLRSTPHGGAHVDLTIFHIPGMDVKLQYQSKVLSEDTERTAEHSPDFEKVFDTNDLFSSSPQWSRTGNYIF